MKSKEAGKSRCHEAEGRVRLFLVLSIVLVALFGAQELEAGLYGTKARQWWPENASPYFGELEKIEGGRVYIIYRGVTRSYAMSELSEADRGFIEESKKKQQRAEVVKKEKAEREAKKKAEIERKQKHQEYIRMLARQRIDREKKERESAAVDASKGDPPGVLQIGQAFRPEDPISAENYSAEVFKRNEDRIAFAYVPYRMVRRVGEEHLAVTEKDVVTVTVYERSFSFVRRNDKNIVSALDQMRLAGDWFGELVEGLKKNGRLIEIDRSQELVVPSTAKPDFTEKQNAYLAMFGNVEKLTHEEFQVTFREIGADRPTRLTVSLAMGQDTGKWIVRKLKFASIRMMNQYLSSHHGQASDKEVSSVPHDVLVGNVFDPTDPATAAAFCVSGIRRTKSDPAVTMFRFVDPKEEPVAGLRVVNWAWVWKGVIIAVRASSFIRADNDEGGNSALEKVCNIWGLGVHLRKMIVSRGDVKEIDWSCDMKRADNSGEEFKSDADRAMAALKIARKESKVSSVYVVLENAEVGRRYRHWITCGGDEFSAEHLEYVVGAQDLVAEMISE